MKKMVKNQFINFASFFSYLLNDLRFKTTKLIKATAKKIISTVKNIAGHSSIIMIKFRFSVIIRLVVQCNAKRNDQ